ncbi:hypothetical protein HAZT_HAZT005895 [Hyalella azteca]|uniref:Uncharacterized protein n=1 Tax=Hyalella azteca TaxID=294128 RepID=A0A6A0HG18_HYAAZ|nr:hypothetical protein HAZT_HAZT005895 [Hyalella azteca]
MKHKELEVPASPGWVRPDDVMKARKLKVKRRALQARMCGSNSKPIMTCEEASGTTGMARCLWGSKSNSDLDTSPNSEFYQRCLVWQHPSIPGVPLFPREGSKANSALSRSASSNSNGVVSSTGPYAGLSEPLMAAWREALRSLHQLIRVRQCPYFYVCAPTFTVVYRAAGVCGIPQAHALLTPTTRGLRRAIKEEGIDFKMPLCKQFSSSQSDGSLSSKSGSDNSCASLASSPTSATEGVSSPLPCKPPAADEDDGVIDDGEDATSFLANLGVDTSQFANLNPDRIVNSSVHEIDRSPLSLLYIADPDTHGLTNFLLNSPSCVQHTGPMAGVPPTLLAPVAFQGATLLPYKVKGSSIRMEGKLKHSMEVAGPILPHTPLQLSSLLTQHLQNFAFTATPVASTLSFSTCTPHLSYNSMSKAFAEGGLVDCGLEASVRSIVCDRPHHQASSGPSETQATDDLKDHTADLPLTYRHVKYSEGKFTWTDQMPTTR